MKAASPKDLIAPCAIYCGGCSLCLVIDHNESRKAQAFAQIKQVI